MEKKILENLMEFGLSDKEAKIYAALLELEIASVSEIAKRTEINRSSAYVVLESLKEKGLVGFSNDKKVQRYIASSPDVLLQTAREAAEKQRSIKENIESIVPELKSLYKDTKHKPIIKVFEGKDVVKKIYLSEDQRPYPETNEIRAYENPEAYKDFLSDFIKIDYNLRKKMGMKMYAIFPQTEETKKIMKEYKSLGSKDEVVMIPKDKFMSYEKFTTFTIVGDEVWFDSIKEGYCISIRKKEIADTLKKVFDLAFKEAKRLNKKTAN